MVEVLTEKSCQKGNITERLVKYLIFHRLSPDKVLCILISKDHKAELFRHRGQIVRFNKGVDGGRFGLFKFEFSEDIEDYKVVQLPERIKDYEN